MMNNILGQLIVGALIMFGVWAMVIAVLNDTARRSK
jgi:hypothetical protein